MKMLTRAALLLSALFACFAPMAVAAQHATQSYSPGIMSPEQTCITWSGTTIGSGTLIPCGTGSGGGGGGGGALVTSYTLLSNASGSGQAVQVSGGNYGFSIAGTFGGATVTLTQVIDGNATTVDTFTAGATGCYAIGNNATLQAIVSGGSPSGLTASLNAIGSCPLGGKITVADGADVTQGATTDSVWSGSGSGSTIAILKKIATGSTGSTTLNAGNAYAGQVGMYCQPFSIPPTGLTTGSMSPVTCGTNGAITINVSGGGNSVAGTAIAADGATNSITNLAVYGRSGVYNGATWDRVRSIVGSDGTGTGVTAVAAAPSSAAGAGIAGASYIGASIISRTTPGNVYYVLANNPTTTAGYVVIVDAASLSGGAALTSGAGGNIRWFWPIAASGGTVDHAFPIPEYATVAANLICTSSLTTYTAISCNLNWQVK